MTEEEDLETYTQLMALPIITEESIFNPQEGNLIRTEEGFKGYLYGRWMLMEVTYNFEETKAKHDKIHAKLNQG